MRTLACAFVVLLSVAASLSLRPAAGEARAPAQTSAEQQLAERFAPVVYLKTQEEACDSRGEPYFPVSVDVVLDNPDVTLRDGSEGDSVVKERPTVADLYQGGEALYLDLPGDPKRPQCNYERYFLGLSPAPPPTVYAHITREDGRDDLVLQYWFYFFFNDWNNNHESDWEFIQLAFEAESAEQALEQEPVSVVYSQHGGGETADWGDSKLKKEGSRPIVYIAAGSHAVQYSAETYLGKAEAGTGFGCDDASGPSYRVDPAVEMILPAVSGPDDPLAWITYEGRWGQRESGEFNGPTGPNRKTPWLQPLTWQEKQRDSSIEVPSESIGPNAAKAFCGIVAFGSQILFAVGPWVLLAMIVGLAGSLTVTVVRTQFVPASIAPLRRRRHFGQIISTALVLMRHHAWLFLGIGVLFLPVGFVTGVVQSFLLRSPPFEQAVDVVDTSAFSALVALGFGVLQFGVTYWIVLNASIAAVDAQEAGRPASVPQAYGDVWRRLPVLARARGRAIAIVALLMLSIFGIPLAIWLGARWIFLEQAILIDGDDARAARERSERAAQGDIARTIGAAVLIVGTAVLVGPILGVLLVLLTSGSLTYINMLSSALYVALVPFAGIGLTLLYFDSVLRCEEEGQDA